jgi:hypothetical protein
MGGRYNQQYFHPWNRNLEKNEKKLGQKNGAGMVTQWLPKWRVNFKSVPTTFFTREYVVLERVFILLCCGWDRLFYLKSNFTGHGWSMRKYISKHIRKCFLKHIHNIKYNRYCIQSLHKSTRRKSMRRKLTQINVKGFL